MKLVYAALLTACLSSASVAQSSGEQAPSPWIVSPENAEIARNQPTSDFEEFAAYTQCQAGFLVTMQRLYLALDLLQPADPRYSNFSSQEADRIQETFPNFSGLILPYERPLRGNTSPDDPFNELAAHMALALVQTQDIWFAFMNDYAAKCEGMLAQ